MKPNRQWSITHWTKRVLILAIMAMIISWARPTALVVGRNFSRVGVFLFQRVTLIGSFNGYFQLADFATSDRGGDRYEIFEPISFPSGRRTHLCKVDWVYVGEWGAGGIFVTINYAGGPLAEPIYSLTVHYGWIIGVLLLGVFLQRFRCRSVHPPGFEIMYPPSDGLETRK